MARDIEEVLEVLVSCAKQGPDRAGAFVDVFRLPLASVVAQKCAIKTRVRVLHQLDLDGRRRFIMSALSAYCFSQSAQMIYGKYLTTKSAVSKIYDFI